MVHVRLTSLGKATLVNRAEWHPVGEVLSDAGGWCKLPLWQFMGIFGGYMIKKEKDFADYFIGDVHLTAE